MQYEAHDTFVQAHCASRRNSLVTMQLHIEGTRQDMELLLVQMDKQIHYVLVPQRQVVPAKSLHGLFCFWPPKGFPP